MTPTSDTQPADAAATFESALNQLGDIVARLESGSLGLSESIDAYERGVAILRRLHEELAAAEERVNVLVRIDDEGRPILEPAATGASPAADSTQPAAPRGPRPPRAKTARPRSLPGMDDAAAEA
ncbi:MAG: exodeoxyribonuclease VII small subunit [Planctomycetaceae bacterium]|nr:exodeoxyribonuclease VII small subunit [Planctomycetaceae bacterium]